MDVVKNEFNSKISSKVTQEIMLHMGKNGIQKIIKRAYEIQKDEEYLKMDP